MKNGDAEGVASDPHDPTVGASKVAEAAEVNEAAEVSKARNITKEDLRVVQVLDFTNLSTNIALF